MERPLPQKTSPPAPQPLAPIYTERPPDPPGLKSCVVWGCLLTCIALMLFSFAGVTVAKELFKRAVTPLAQIFERGPEEISVSLPTIEEIRELGRLDTLEINLSTVVTVINPRKLGPLKADEVLVYNVCGIAIAGVELDELEATDVIVSGSAITISLPSAQVFTVDLMLSPTVPDTEAYALETEDRKAQILPTCSQAIEWDVPPFVGEKTPELIRVAEEQAMVQFRAIVEEKRFIDQARRNAEQELKRFLQFAGFEQVQFAMRETLAQTGE